MKKTERKSKIMDILKKQNGISAKELANIFNVSEMTIRRDLEDLKKSDLILNSYGAFFINDSSQMEGYFLDNASTKYTLEKKLIGEFAASLVTQNDILIIDTGSTTEVLTKALPTDIPLTALCYNYNILSQLVQKPNINTIFAGGYYHADTQMFESTQGLSLIQATRANKVFISAAGIHETLGVTCANNYEIATKQAIFESGIEKILLADSSKFDIVKPSYFAEISNFDTIITDNKISQKWVDILTQYNIKLHIV